MREQGSTNREAEERLGTELPLFRQAVASSNSTSFHNKKKKNTPELQLHIAEQLTLMTHANQQV